MAKKNPFKKAAQVISETASRAKRAAIKAERQARDRRRKNRIARNEAREELQVAARALASFSPAAVKSFALSGGAGVRARAQAQQVVNVAGNIRNSFAQGEKLSLPGTPINRAAIQVAARDNEALARLYDVRIAITPNASERYEKWSQLSADELRQLGALYQSGVFTRWKEKERSFAQQREAQAQRSRDLGETPKLTAADFAAMRDALLNGR